MKTLISGHRQFKLEQYDTQWIQETLELEVINNCLDIIGLSGMADGIDLLYCELLAKYDCGYHCYIPFYNQSEYMTQEDSDRRNKIIDNAWKTYFARNHQMVKDADCGIIVWDGNKGGTHNVFQQMIEMGKPFTWIEPVNKRIIYL